MSHLVHKKGPPGVQSSGPQDGGERRAWGSTLETWGSDWPVTDALAEGPDRIIRTGIIRILWNETKTERIAASRRNIPGPQSWGAFRITRE